jgi:hypothetical protein
MKFSKFAFLAFAFASLSALASGGGTSVNSVARFGAGPALEPVYEIVAPNGHLLQNSNHITATFELNCKQTLVQLVRMDVDNPAKGAVDILLGALVTDTLTSECKGNKSVSLDAGLAYSGRAYDVMAISEPVKNSVPSSPVYRVMPLDHYALDKSRPPQVEASFQVLCNHTFVNVLRFDLANGATGKTDIVLGGLVLEDPSITCTPDNGAGEVTKDAGAVTETAFDVKPVYPW